MPRPSLLFDMYGVLMRLPGADHHARVERAVGTGPQIWPAYEDLRIELDAGRMTEQTYWKQVAARSGVGPVDAHAAAAADYSDSVDAVRPVVEAVLGLIGQGWHVGVLSNIPAGLAALVRRRHGEWLAAFDAVTFSCDIGVAKPEREAFDVAVDAMGATAAETVFFDDCPAYLDGARAAGLTAVQFTGWDSVVGALEL